MIVITDAVSHDDSLSVASQIKAMNVEIFAVSVGTRFMKSVIESMVSQPVNKHLFSSKESSENLLNSVKAGSCKGRQTAVIHTNNEPWYNAYPVLYHDSFHKKKYINKMYH